MDPFSAAAGAFSVISLAIQLVGKIQEIRNFWTSIEDASTDVGDILHELDCVLGILEGVAELEAISGSSNNGALLKALQACGIYVRRLSACVHDLKSGFAGGRPVRAWTSLRFTLRRERIRTSQGALERVKTCLVLAQMLSQEQARVQDMRLVRENIACIRSSLLAMKPEKSHAVVVRPLSTDLLGDTSSSFGDRPEGTAQHNHPRLQSESEDGRELFYKRPVQEPETLSPRLISRSKRKTALTSFQHNTYMTALADIHYQSRTINLESVFEDDDVNRQQQIETFISVHPKPWLLGRGFALSYSTSGKSWIPQFGFQLRHYNIRPEEALIFEFCSYGNIEGVKSLLRRGDASPFDCDPEGWTPLHYAAQAHNHAICRLLVQHGASGSVLDLSNRSALHTALNLSPWAIRSIRHSGSPAPSDDHIKSRLEQTVRILVERTDIDMSIESSEGNTFLDIAIRSPIARPLVRWLSRDLSTEFDVDHRNAQGKTMLMQQAEDNTDIAESLKNMKHLLALGADLDAKVLDKPNASRHDIGATALHLATEFYRWSPSMQRFGKVRYLLSQGANPHAISSSGHTATDRILEGRSLGRFLHWRTMLLELGFNLKAFVRAEIDVHANVPWYGSNGCDEFVLELFGFKPKFDSATGTIEFLPLSEAKALDDMVSAQDVHLSPTKDDESTFDLFNDTEPEQVYSSNSEYESADEDIVRPRWKRIIKAPEAYRTKLQGIIAGGSLLDGLSQYRSAKPDSSRYRSSRYRRSWHTYAAVLETGDLESWKPRDRLWFEDRWADYSWLVESQSEYVSE